jgi:hypothetical protein
MKNLLKKLEKSYCKFKNNFFRENIETELMQKLLSEFSTKKAEDLFSNGKYNMDLFQYALNKVCEEERKEREEQKKKNGETEEVGFFSNVYDKLTSVKSWGYLTLVFVLISLGLVSYNIFSRGRSLPNIKI